MNKEKSDSSSVCERHASFGRCKVVHRGELLTTRAVSKAARRKWPGDASFTPVNVGNRDDTLKRCRRSRFRRWMREYRSRNSRCSAPPCTRGVGTRPTWPDQTSRVGNLNSIRWMEILLPGFPWRERGLPCLYTKPSPVRRQWRRWTRKLNDQCPPRDVSCERRTGWRRWTVERVESSIETGAYAEGQRRYVD